jgi:type II secretory pathway pseudopilin PulG
MRTPRGNATAGFSLLELLIVSIMLVAVIGTSYTLFKSQSVSFRQNTDRFDMVQNARGALELAERVIRTMGAGVSGQQPVLVYGNDNVIAFNADFVERDTVNMRWAAYWNPDVPLAETQVWQVSAAAAIPNSSPSYTYPSVTYVMGNGTASPAETYILYVELDGSTPRSDDYALMQRVNGGNAEVLARSLLPATGGAPFFQYLLHRVLPSGDTMFVAGSSELPLARRALVPGISSVDSANYVRPDSVRAVRMNYRISNGLEGIDERTRSISTVIEVPNNGILMPDICGRAPFPPGAFAAVDAGDGSGRVTLTWSRSVDQDAGEQDVRQYIIWRRLAASATFAQPLLVSAAESGTATYTTEFTDQVPGSSYVFGIAAQDCTPALSSMSTATVTVAAP